MKTNTAQQNIPSGWTEVALTDVSSVNPEQINPNESPDDFFQYIDIASVKDFKIQEMKTVTGLKAPSRARRLVKKGDILISNVRPNLKGICKVPTFSTDTLCSTGFSVVRANTVDENLLYQILSEDKFTDYLVDKTTGSNYPSVSSNDVSSYEFLIPKDKSEQQNIAEILGTVDEDIAKTQEVIKATEKLKRGLMQQLFSRGIGHTKFKETKVGKIPETWEAGGFLNFVNPEDKNAIKPGPFGSSLKKSFYVEKGFKIYGQEQVISGNAFYGNYYVNEEKYKELEGFKVEAGDILISLVGTIGKILVVPDNFEKGIINPRLLKITPDKTKADSQFIAQLLKSDFLIEQMGKKSHGGTMNILNKGMLMSVTFGVPPITEQKEIAEILSAVDEKILVNKKLKSKLTLLKKGLMQDLLSGAKRVNI